MSGIIRNFEFNGLTASNAARKFHVVVTAPNTHGVFVKVRAFNRDTTAGNLIRLDASRNSTVASGALSAAVTGIYEDKKLKDLYTTLASAPTETVKTIGTAAMNDVGESYKTKLEVAPGESKEMETIFVNPGETCNIWTDTAPAASTFDLKVTTNA